MGDLFGVVFIRITAGMASSCCANAAGPAVLLKVLGNIMLHVLPPILTS
jgi:hypothetical protein